MTSPCTKIIADPQARQICSRYVKQHGTRNIATLDKGTHFIQFPRTKNGLPSVATKNAGNGIIEAGEWRRWFLEQGGSSPWIIKDRKLRAHIQSGIQKIKTKLLQKRWSNKTVFNKAFVQKLIAWAVTPKVKRGLGLKPIYVNPLRVKTQRTAEEILRAPSNAPGNPCMETSLALHAIFRLAGLSSKLMLVYKNLYGLISLKHVCVGVRLDPSRPQAITPIDITLPNRHQWINPPHPVVRPMSQTTAMAAHLQNKASVLLSRNLHSMTALRKSDKKILRLFTEARNYDADFPLTFYNTALYYMWAKFDYETAKKFLKKALTLFPAYRDAQQLFNQLLRTTRSGNRRRPR